MKYEERSSCYYNQIKRQTASLPFAYGRCVKGLTRPFAGLGITIRAVPHRPNCPPALRKAVEKKLPPLVRRRWPRNHQGREPGHQRAILGAPSRVPRILGVKGETLPAVVRDRIRCPDPAQKDTEPGQVAEVIWSGTCAA